VDCVSLWFAFQRKNLTIDDLAQLGPVAEKIPADRLSRHLSISGAVSQLILDANRNGQQMKEEELTRFWFFVQSYLLRKEGSGARATSRAHKRYCAVEEQLKLLIEASADSGSLPQAANASKPQQKDEDAVIQAVRRATRMMQLGYVSKASRALQQKGLANHADPAVIARMRALHPQNKDPMPDCPPSLPVQIESAKIAHFVEKMAKKALLLVYPS
jgi:hypothetical protein